MSDIFYLDGSQESFRARIATLEAELKQARELVDGLQTRERKSLLRSTHEPVAGCYCGPGRCMAPTITGRQMPCLDPAKAARTKQEGQ